ncbi:hypothetical protein L195_g035417, partial [Trifolium pratense]
MHIGDPWCNHYVDVVVDTMHMLRDCPLAKSVWCNLVNGETRETFFTAVLEEWVVMNMCNELGRNNNVRRIETRDRGAWRREITTNTTLDLHLELGSTVDSSVVAHILNSSNEGSVIGWRFIQEIGRLLALEWEIKVCHSQREANACADTLANMGYEHGPGLQLYDQCPPRLSSLVLAD